MNTTPWITLGVMIGSSLIVSAEDKKPQRLTRPDGPPPAIMEKFDADKDGKLSEDERKAMHAAKEAKMEEHKKEMIAKFDKDGDGKLNDEERAKMPKRPMHPGGPEGKRGPDGKGKHGPDGKGKRGPHGPGAPDDAGPADAPETKAPAVE